MNSVLLQSEVLVLGREHRVCKSCVWINTHLNKYWSKAFITKVVAVVRPMNLRLNATNSKEEQQPAKVQQWTVLDYTLAYLVKNQIQNQLWNKPEQQMETIHPHSFMS